MDEKSRVQRTLERNVDGFRAYMSAALTGLLSRMPQDTQQDTLRKLPLIVGQAEIVAMSAVEAELRLIQAQREALQEVIEEQASEEDENRG
jgi:hypothetical protein